MFTKSRQSDTRFTRKGAPKVKDHSKFKNRTLATVYKPVWICLAILITGIWLAMPFVAAPEGLLGPAMFTHVGALGLFIWGIRGLVTKAYSSKDPSIAWFYWMLLGAAMVMLVYAGLIYTRG